ncbi:MAG TPA: NADH-quinone oxidoreductase subunit NuoH [Actinomycetes bacterium]|jgi:NADH-quinone oxidoreductase subunit H|nr:NADH-quinone oxidoreductase subunit NuoH [Actinomycetes bacterium]
MIWDLFILLVKVVGVFAFLMLTVLFVIWLERKVVAFMQTRIGPNRVGPAGLLQSLADGIKLFFKEDVRPTNADRILYVLAPVVMMVPAFLSITVLPFGSRFGTQDAQLTDLNVGLLFVLAMGSLQVYGIVLAGWASGSNYPLLGAVRSSAQMISYEIAQGLSIVGVLMYAGTLSAGGIVAAQQGDPIWGFVPRWYIVPQLPMFLVFLVAGIAETNRAPFDLPEAESELVGGYHTEYSGVKFALFFLAEYLNIITVSAVATTLFLGGPDGPVIHGFLPWLWPILWFVAKIYLFIFVFIWLRATLPRLRFDRLMAIGWKYLIPIALFWIAVTSVVLTVDLSAVNRRVLYVAIGVLVVLLLASLFVPGPKESRKRPGTPDRTAPGGSTS